MRISICWKQWRKSVFLVNYVKFDILEMPNIHIRQYLQFYTFLCYIFCLFEMSKMIEYWLYHVPILVLFNLDYSKQNTTFHSMPLLVLSCTKQIHTSHSRWASKIHAWTVLALWFLFEAQVQETHVLTTAYTFSNNRYTSQERVRQYQTNKSCLTS